MSLIDVQNAVQAAQRDVAAAVAALGSLPAVSGLIQSGDLQAALMDAASEAVLLLDPTLVEPNPVVLSKPVTLVSPGGASLMGGVQITAPDCGIIGPVVCRNSALTDIVVVTGGRALLIGTQILGDPAKGGKRGIAANGPDLIVRGVLVDNIFLAGQDSQAICGWDNCINLLVDDCQLYAAGETVMIGGADPASADRQPRNVTIRNSTLSKRLAWKGLAAAGDVKDVLEFKDCLGALVEDCVLENCWAAAQVGYLIVLTPRNQDGTAPYSNVTDITIRNCTGGHAAALLNILGTDNEAPSGRTSGLTLQGCSFTDIDPSVWVNPTTGEWGSDKLILVGGGPADVTIDGNTISGAHIGSQVYFYDCANPKCANFRLTNNKWPTSTYGIFGDTAPVGSGIGPYCDAASVMSGNVEA